MIRFQSQALPFFLLYGAMYAAFGAASPFWPVFFTSRGMSPEQLGLLLALGTLTRLLAGPLVGCFSDWIKAPRLILAVCTALAVVAALSFLPAHGFVPLLLIAIFQAAALTPVTAIADALAINAAERGRRRFEYGWVRGVGSAAFVAGTLVTGQVLSQALVESSAIIWLHAALLSGVILATPLVPALSPPRADVAKSIADPSLVDGVRELLSNAVFRKVLAVTALVFGSHAMHDGFAVIRWTSAGLCPIAVSLLWSEAVLAEVVVFFVVGPLVLDRFGPSGAAAMAAIAGVVRWTAMSATTDIAALALVQPLHGLTFAILHLACMRLIGASVPARLAASAQSFYAFAAAVSSGMLSFVSGLLYGELGAAGFLAMALLCGVALPIALTLPRISRTSDRPARATPGSG
jgi:PPP family 3-phenylpropionic acid transporter